MLPSLSPAEEILLLRYADPQAPASGADGLTAGSLMALLANAEFHGVLPIMLRKLHEHGFDRLPKDAELAKTLAGMRDRQTLATGQSMLLRYHGERILRALAAENIPAKIVKGPVFAAKLYRNGADRPFTDIDILVDAADLVSANRVIAASGFVLSGDPARSSALQEFKWLEKDNASLLIELHGNLVHDTGMRRRISLGFQEIRAINGDVADTPAALLTIAVVHAAGGHKFHRLQLCVDVLQGVRTLGSPEAEDRLFEAARMTGIGLELATVLNVTGQLFGERRLIELADRIEPDLGIRLARRLITRESLLNVGSSAWLGSRLRRDAFRWIQRLAPPRPSFA